MSIHFGSEPTTSANPPVLIKGTPSEAAKRILESKGITDVQIVKSGESNLVDNYNPKSNIITLSKRVYEGTSISALGVAAHEVGHAIQYSENYAGIKIRTALAYVSNFMSSIVWPLILFGIILDVAYIGGLVGDVFLYAGVVFFGVSLLFTICTLPVELDASNRALKLLVSTGCVDSMEVKGARKVLSAAAKTYVAEKFAKLNLKENNQISNNLSSFIV